MRPIPDTWLFEPWKMTPEIQDHLGLQGESHIIKPIVHLEDAIRNAKDRLHSRKKSPSVKAGKQGVIQKHASRSNSMKRGASKKEKVTNHQQLGFEFWMEPELVSYLLRMQWDCERKWAPWVKHPEWPSVNWIGGEKSLFLFMPVRLDCTSPTLIIPGMRFQAKYLFWIYLIWYLSTIDTRFIY